MSTETAQLNRLNDVLVKYIFFDEARKPLTLSLINAFFEAEGTPTIVDFTFQDREPDPDDPKGKQPRLDILGICSDGTVVEIEFQNDVFEAMADRVIFYWGRIAQKKSRGVPYSKLPRIVCINILGYTMFPDLADYHNCYMVMNTRHAGNCLSQRLELHFAEVPKWEKQRHHTTEMDQLSRWLAYFSQKTSTQELEELAMNDPMIREALSAQKQFQSNTELMSAYEWAEKARLDRQANQEYWENRGEKKGEKKGRIKTAKNLLTMNMSFEQIAQATELTVSEVEALAVAR